MSHLLSEYIQKNIQLLFPSQDNKQDNKAINQSSAGFYSRLSTTQYKNAIHFGKINNIHQKHGIGIVFYDNGDILIADFYQDKIKGHFFYFDSQLKGMCYYGAMDHNTQKLDGVCHVYARNGLMTQGMYQQGKLLKNWFSKDIENKIIKHQIMQSRIFIDQDFQLQSQNNKLIIKSVKRKKKNLESQFITPTDFLILNLTKQPNTQSQILLTNQPFQTIQTQFQLFQIAKNQTYYGILQKNRPNGFGIIFLNDWPVCYGSFINGQLHGLARVQQNKTLILDGIFDGSSLKMGWVFNFQENLTCFGVLQKDNGEVSDRRVFQLRQQFANIQVQKVMKFRRNFHIKSLTYINSHTLQYGKKIAPQFQFQQIEFMNSDVNQHNYLSQKFNGSQLYQNFIPSYISEIQRVNGNMAKSKLIMHKQQNYESNNNVQRGLLQLIKQYHENASNFEKAQKIINNQIKRQQKYQQSIKNRSRSKSKISEKNKQIKFNQQQNKRNQEKIPLKQQQKKQQRSENKNKDAKVQNINKIPNKISRSKKKEEKQGMTQRKQAKRLNLQQIYSKYLKKLQKYNTRSS